MLSDAYLAKALMGKPLTEARIRKFRRHLKSADQLERILALIEASQRPVIRDAVMALGAWI